MNAHKDGCYLDDEHRGYCRQRPKPDLYVRGLDPLRARAAPPSDTDTTAPGPRWASTITVDRKPETGLPNIWNLVFGDIMKAKTHDNRKPFDGSDPLATAYNEALELVAHLRQALYERGRCDDCGMDHGMHDMSVEH